MRGSFTMITLMVLCLREVLWLLGRYVYVLDPRSGISPFLLCMDFGDGAKESAGCS